MIDSSGQPRELTGQPLTGAALDGRPMQEHAAAQSPRRPSEANPGPWRFALSIYGIRHAITDAEGRLLASNVPIGSGPLLSAAPDLLAALERVAAVAPAGSEAREIAADALLRHREREAIMLEGG